VMNRGWIAPPAGSSVSAAWVGAVRVPKVDHQQLAPELGIRPHLSGMVDQGEGAAHRLPVPHQGIHQLGRRAVWRRTLLGICATNAPCEQRCRKEPVQASPGRRHRKQIAAHRRDAACL
jgi:hypothetical protein